MRIAMDASEKKRLIHDWIAFHYAKEETPEYEELRWAEKALSNLSYENPLICLELVLGILNSDTSDRVIENLAAGPVEDMLIEKGDQVIDLIEEQALKNPYFKKLLGGVWLNDNAPSYIVSRLEAIRGKPW